ncbi:MAG: YncE family protein [Thermoplasmata archaeon]
MSQLSTIAVGGYPFGEAYDPANARLFVADFAANYNSMTAIDTVTNKVVATINLSYGVSNPVFDAADGLVYIGTCCSQIYAIDANTSQVVATVTLGVGCYPGCAPGPAVYDPASQDVYFEDGFTSNVTVIHGRTVTLITNVGPYPYGIGYDSRNGNVYVSNEGNSSLTIINGHTNQIAGWIPGVQPGPAVVADAANGEIFVGGNNVSGQAKVTIVDGTTNRVVGNVLTRNASGDAAYDPITEDVYVTQRFNNNYTPSDVWNVTAISGTTNRMVGILPTQRGPIGIAYADYNHEMYVADSDTNNVSLLFPLHTVSFVETGLTPRTPWSVHLNNVSLSSNTTSVPFTGADGPYQYSVKSIRNYTVSPQVGTFTMNGTNVTVDITYVPVAFSATFNETGLPSGTSWSVTLNNSTESSPTQTLAFTLKNGTYNYTVNPPSGYTVVPTNDSIKILGANRTISLVFTAIPKTPAWSFLGLSVTQWSLILAVVVVVAALAIFVLFRRRRTKEDTAAATTPHPAPLTENRPP